MTRLPHDYVDLLADIARSELDELRHRCASASRVARALQAEAQRVRARVAASRFERLSCSPDDLGSPS